MARDRPALRDSYRYFHRISTRWTDNDMYGHVNNVAYLSWFDTAVNHYLINAKVLHPSDGQVVGFVAETQCQYFSPLAFPQPIEAALRVASIGNSSVRYEVGIFAEGAKVASAQGHFVHVYVDRATAKPTSVPPSLLAALQEIAT